MAIWWCEHYNRPLKDPMLQEYSLEDLIYERFIVMERAAYIKEMEEEETDRIEEEKLQEDDDWADQMETMLGNQEAKKQPEPKKEPKEEYDPTKDPENIKWMEQEMEANKSFFGDDFGEDIDINFEDD